MAKDSMRSNFQAEPRERNPISDTEIGAVYRLLAHEHVALRSGVTPQAKEVLADGIWEKIEAQQQGQSVSSSIGPAARGRLRFAPPRMLGAVVACAAVLFGVFYFGRGFRDGDWASELDANRISFEVDGTVVGADPSRRGGLVASESDPVGIRLSDRSQLNLQPHTTLRLATLENGGVTARLAQGVLDAEVVHQEDTNYRFFAGPYLVKVIGTAFRLSYEPEGESLDLKMRSGVVEVVGADGESKMVRGGESLHWEAGGQSHEATGLDRVPDESPSDARLGNSPKGQKVEGVPEANEAKTREVSRSRASPSLGTASEGQASLLGPSDFRQLATQGRFSEIVRIADDYGVDRLLVQGSVSQLQELAQAARYSDRLALAERVWGQMSSRFSSTLSGKNALFFLGRLDEQRGRSSSALARYERYLRTSPGGVYAQEAWGRKLQLIQKSGDARATVRVAQQYLRRFPQGPFAATARQLSGKVSER